MPRLVMKILKVELHHHANTTSPDFRNVAVEVLQAKVALMLQKRY